MRQTYSPIPEHWDNTKFEQDFNCVAYAENDELVVVSDEGIEDLDKKVEANAAAYQKILKDKKDLMARLGLTEEDIKLLLI